MAQLLGLIKLEWKQHWRGGLIWLILAVALLYANPFYTASPSLWESLYQAIGRQSMVHLGLLLGLLGVISARRNQRLHVAELVDATAVDSHRLLVGQWLGLVLTAVSLLAILHLLVTAVMLSLGARPDLAAFFRSLLVMCFPWALFMLTTGFVLASFMPSLVSMLVLGGIWYATGILAFFGNLGRWLSAPWLSLIDPFTLSTASASVSFGFMPLDRLIYNRLFYLGASLLILGTGALFYKRSRQNRFSRRMLGVSLVGFIIILAVTGASLLQFQTRRGSILKRPQQPLDNEARVEKYEMDFSLEQNQKEMALNVAISVRNAGAQALDTLVFLLHRDLTVVEITFGEEHQPLAWQKDGVGYYRVKLPFPLRAGERTNITFSYFGSIAEWYLPGWGKEPEPLAFLTAQGLVLPPSVHWYPVLGAKAELQSALKQFTLRIRGNKRPLAINLPQVADELWVGFASDLFLASANWDYLQEGNFRLWHTPEQNESAALLLAKLNFMHKLCQKYLGPAAIEEIPVLTVPEALYQALQTDIDPEQTGVLFVTDTRLASEAKTSPQSYNLNLYQQELFQDVLGLWLGSGHGLLPQSGSHKRAVLASYLWTLFRDAYPGLPGTSEDEAEFRRLRIAGASPTLFTSFPAGLTLPGFSQAENELWFELDGIRRHKGEAALIARLRQLLAELKQEGGR